MKFFHSQRRVGVEFSLFAEFYHVVEVRDFPRSLQFWRISIHIFFGKLSLFSAYRRAQSMN